MLNLPVILACYFYFSFIMPKRSNVPSDVLELLFECLVEPSVEDGVRERRRHPDQVAEREADAAHLLVLEKQ